MGGNRSSGVILCGEDVAGGPAHFGAEGHQGFDQNGGLNRHVQRAGNASPLEGLLGAVLGPQRHQAGHFRFGDRHFLAPEIGLGEIGDHIGRRRLKTGKLSRRAGGCCHHGADTPDWEDEWDKSGLEVLRRRRGFGLAWS